MKYLLFILSFFGFAIIGWTQNYQTVNSSEIKLFKTGLNSFTRGYRVDSVRVIGNDSLLYPSRSIQKVGEEWDDWDDCTDVHGASILGDYVRIMPNGTNLFFNKYADTIRIETRATQGESWVLWAGEEYSVYGEMLGTELGVVFGVPDSVKSIKLNAYDVDMNLVESFIYNDSLIVISKNYGLLSTFNFVVFPNDYEAYFDIPLELYNLYGILSQGLGGGNLTTFEIFDFQPGDIFQIERALIDFGIGTKKQILQECLSRENFTDSIVYHFLVTVLTFEFSGIENPELSVSSYQSIRTIKPIGFLDMLPALPIESNNSEGGYYSVRMNKEVFLQKQNLEYASTGNIYYPTGNDDCYMQIIDGTCNGQPSSYYKGLGGPYHECDIFANLNYEKLVYYEKDSIVWGTPFDFTVSLGNKSKQQFFSVFPNPASDKVTIRFDKVENALYEILDISGRSVQQRTLVSSQAVIDISELRSGVYFIRLSHLGNVGVKKLVVQ